MKAKVLILSVGIFGLLLFIHFRHPAPHLAFDETNENGEATTGQSQARFGPMTSQSGLRVPAAKSTDESIQLSKEELSLRARRARFEKFNRERLVASVGAFNLSGRELPTASLNFGNRRMAGHQLLLGFRALPNNLKVLPEGFEKRVDVGPFIIAEAKQGKVLDALKGAAGKQLFASSLPVLFEARGERIHIVTGRLKIRLKSYDENSVAQLLADFKLEKVGAIEGIRFLEARVPEGADVFDVLKRLEVDTRVDSVDLDLYSRRPSLK